MAMLERIGTGGGHTGSGQVAVLLPPPVLEVEDSDADEEEKDEVGQAALTSAFEAGEHAKLASSSVVAPSLASSCRPSAALVVVEDSAETAASERAHQQAVASISTLAVHIQRAKPQEWNELIQVVLQGLVLARSAAGPGSCVSRCRGAPAATVPSSGLGAAPTSVAAGHSISHDVSHGALATAARAGVSELS